MTAEDTNALTSARLDLWLWSVRIFKTRSLAADECKGGHVRVNDAPGKPSQKLKKGYTELKEGEAAPEKREYSEEEKADYFFWEAIEKSYKYNKKDYYSRFFRIWFCTHMIDKVFLHHKSRTSAYRYSPIS